MAFVDSYATQIYEVSFLEIIPRSQAWTSA